MGKNLGIPLPSSTQWDVVEKASEALEMIWSELVREAAQGDVVHIDDTKARILALNSDLQASLGKGNKERKGIFTSGIVSKVEEREIVLFYTGNSHAGESLEKVMRLREEERKAAIQYMKNHWEALTQFMKVEGAPLDNNVGERIIKRAILHQKNSLFYKTTNGTKVGDQFMSIIHTVELQGGRPFDYLVIVQRHKELVMKVPSEWMPWNDKETMRQLGLPSP